MCIPLTDDNTETNTLKCQSVVLCGKLGAHSQFGGDYKDEYYLLLKRMAWPQVTPTSKYILSSKQNKKQLHNQLHLSGFPHNGRSTKPAHLVEPVYPRFRSPGSHIPILLLTYPMPCWRFVEIGSYLGHVILWTDIWILNHTLDRILENHIPTRTAISSTQNQVQANPPPFFPNYHSGHSYPICGNQPLHRL